MKPSECRAKNLTRGKSRANHSHLVVRPRSYHPLFEILEERLALSGVSISTLAVFNAATGDSPQAGLLEDNGNFFGTTNIGGANGYGTVFELAAGSSTITPLASFNGTNGKYPVSGLIEDSSGDLFGTTYEGGANNDGTVFEVAAGSGIITPLASFNGTNGSEPEAGLVADNNGNFFGTTSAGGTHNLGTVFELAAGSGTITPIVSFDGTNGSLPNAGLIEDNGNLFGTTLYGGTNGASTVFEVAIASGTITSLSFDPSGSNGNYPNGDLIEDAQGNLFGTTRFGGANAWGALYEIKAGFSSISSITLLASFDTDGTSGTNGTGSEPMSNLVEDTSGDLFGTTFYAGANGLGTVYELVAGEQTITPLASFDGSNGESPLGNLIQDGSGNIFGTASDGGGIGAGGTVFEVQPQMASQLIVTSSLDLANPATPTPGTLRYAVEQANTDAASGLSDTITFDTAKMGGNVITLHQGYLELAAGTGTTTIDGGDQVSINGGGKSSVFVVDSKAQAVLTGLTIDNGKAQSGAGIDNSGTLTVSNVTIANNIATGFSSGSTGGGIYNAGTFTLTDSTVANNDAGNDSQGGRGGGICNVGTLTVTDSTVANNTAQNARSQAGNGGGGIYNGGSLTLRATTVSGNVAYNVGADGGGIANTNVATLTMMDTIVAGNTCQNAGTDPDILGSVLTSSAYNLIGIGTLRLAGIRTGTNGNQVGTSSVPIKALLAPLGNYGGTTQTMALLPGSPAAASGEPITGITTDQRGQPVASPPSIGAYQTAKVATLQVSPATITPTADTLFVVTITAEDASGQTVAGASFPVALSYSVQTSNSTVGHTVSPATITLTNGIWKGTITLHYPGSATLLAVAGLLAGISKIHVLAAVPVSLAVINPAPAPYWTETAGVAFPLTVNALDAGGLPPIGYSGLVTLAVTGNSQPVLGLTHSALTLVNGTWTGNITLDKAADVTLTASAVINAAVPPITITGTSGAISVGALKANHYTVTAVSSQVTAGTPFPLTIQALDKYNNLTNWPFINGLTVTIVCSGGQTVYQGTPSFTFGTDTLPVTLDRAGGPFTLTVSTGALNGKLGGITVYPGATTSFLVKQLPVLRLGRLPRYYFRHGPGCVRQHDQLHGTRCDHQQYRFSRGQHSSSERSSRTAGHRRDDKGERQRCGRCGARRLARHYGHGRFDHRYHDEQYQCGAGLVQRECPRSRVANNGPRGCLP